MQYETPGWIIGTQIIIVIASIITAVILEKKRQNKETTRPYTWGYFNGAFCVITSAVVLLIILAALFLIDARVTQEIMFVIAAAGVFFWLGMLTIKRVCWAFVIATILSFNPIAYLINGIYIYRRRKELD
jgi:hypothetical protein